MTLFKKLAGKASALLNASGICSNNCIDGYCSGCGECCADLLPLTKGEIKRLRDYARKHHLQENKRSFLETKGGPDLSCPFRNEWIMTTEEISEILKLHRAIENGDFIVINADW